MTTSNRAVVTIYHHTATGTVFGAEASVHPEVASTFSERDALGLLVYASGLAPGSVPSVTEAQLGGPAVLTDQDEAALCFVHGQPPACAVP